MPATEPESCLIDIYDDVKIGNLRRRYRLDPFFVKQMRFRFFRKCDGIAKSIAHFPDEVREIVRRSVSFHHLELEQRRDSQVDGATKLLFRTATGASIESVALRSGTGRTTLCLSAQVGCAAACEFCATGYMPVTQNLSTSEILDQVVQAGEMLATEGRSVRNLVFMGMGEPLHNEQHLHQAIELLVSSEHFQYPPSRILVSTVGVASAMLRLVRRFPEVNLAVSLHSTHQSQREKMIPIARKYPLDEIHRTLKRINSLQSQPVMIEYLMLADVNDSNADAQRLLEFVRDLNVHFNLIPYNRIAEAPHLDSSPKTVRDRFANILRDAGYIATIRYSLGADIDAACGQLASREV